MARIRTIKPEFWTSEQIAECSPNVRLMFVGMWNFSDDYGVSPASVHRLKTQIFPADAFSREEIASWVAELIRVGLIEEYEIDGQKYWHVTGWMKHQNVESATGKWPLPDGSIGKKVRGRQNDGYQRSPKDQAEIRGTFDERSTNDHQTFDEHSPRVNQKEKEKEKEEKLSALPKYSEDFLSFWSLYPRRIEKASAWKAWNTRVKEGHDPKTIIEGAKRYADDVKRQKTEERFIKHPSTFLGPTTPFVEWSEKEVQEDEDDDDYYRITECSFLTAEERAAERAKKEKADQAK